MTEYQIAADVCGLVLCALFWLSGWYDQRRLPRVDWTGRRHIRHYIYPFGSGEAWLVKVPRFVVLLCGQPVDAHHLWLPDYLRQLQGLIWLAGFALGAHLGGNARFIGLAVLCVAYFLESVGTRYYKKKIRA